MVSDSDNLSGSNQKMLYVVTVQQFLPPSHPTSFVKFNQISNEILQVWSGTPSFVQSSWLPVSSRTDYKISTLCFNAFTNSSPVYIAQLLSVYTPSRHLCSSLDTHSLRIPFVNTKSFDQKAFSFTGATQWNFLPHGLWHSESSPAFKTGLKTHLFRSTY